MISSAISCHFLPFVLSLLTGWPYPWHSLTAFSFPCSPPPSRLSPLLSAVIHFFFPISESGLRSWSQMRFGGQGLRALPPLQIEVSYCRLHAGINHLLFPTSLNQAATHWKEGGRTDSVSYFLPLCFFHHAFFVNFFASSSWCLHFASKDKMRGVFDSHISGNIVSWHSRSKVIFPQQMFFSEFLDHIEMWAAILFRSVLLHVKCLSIWKHFFNLRKSQFVFFQCSYNWVWMQKNAWIY